METTSRRRIEITRAVALGLVLAASDQGVELDTAPGGAPRARATSPSAPARPRAAERVLVAGDEEHGVAPASSCHGSESSFRAAGACRPTVVIVRSPVSSTCVNAQRCGSPRRRGVNLHAAQLELLARAAAELVVAERREQRSPRPRAAPAGARPRRPRRPPAPSPRSSGRCRPGPAVARRGRSGSTRRARRRRLSRAAVSQIGRPRRLQGMMNPCRPPIPPSRLFYREHRDAVLGVLRRRARGAAGPRTHSRRRFCARSPRTVASATASISALGCSHRDQRRDRHAPRGHAPTEEPREVPHEDARPPTRSLSELTDGLPRKERAAVVLRYGYDLTYEQIAAALDSSPVAARQAASAGVRRLRAGRTMTVPTDLDQPFPRGRGPVRAA